MGVVYWERIVQCGCDMCTCVLMWCMVYVCVCVGAVWGTKGYLYVSEIFLLS